VPKGVWGDAGAPGCPSVLTVIPFSEKAGQMEFEKCEYRRRAYNSSPNFGTPVAKGVILPHRQS